MDSVVGFHKYELLTVESLLSLLTKIKCGIYLIMET